MTRWIGRYEVFDPIASGGMARVHLGRQLGEAGFSRVVAIKRLHDQLASEPEFVATLLDEARLASRIQHPNVVPTLDVVASDGEVLMVLEYIAGQTFARLLRASRGEPVPYRIVTHVVAGALHGLHAAHEARAEDGSPLHIVHRDVSPQNIGASNPVIGWPLPLQLSMPRSSSRHSVARSDFRRFTTKWISMRDAALSSDRDRPSVTP